MNEAYKFAPDPVDWQQLELLAHVSPAQRLLTMMEASEFVLAGLRGTMAKRFPDLDQRELNMKVLAYVTPLRGPVSDSSIWPTLFDF